MKSILASDISLFFQLTPTLARVCSTDRLPDLETTYTSNFQVFSIVSDMAVTMPTNVWLDCDPGHDDAIAIVLAALHPKITLVGISTVAGNQSVDLTTVNAARMLAICGIEDVDVVAGASRPLLRSARHDSYV